MKKLTMTSIIFFVLSLIGCSNEDLIKRALMIDDLQDNVSAPSSLIPETEIGLKIENAGFEKAIADLELSPYGSVELPTSKEAILETLILDESTSAYAMLIASYGMLKHDGFQFYWCNEERALVRCLKRLSVKPTMRKISAT